MSAPALKKRPSPVITMALTFASSNSEMMASEILGVFLEKMIDLRISLIVESKRPLQ